MDHRGGFSSSVFVPHHAATRLVVRFPQTEDSLRDARRDAAASSAAPDEFSFPDSCTPPMLPNFPTREIGNPVNKRIVNIDIQKRIQFKL